jgi:hypothetical protein
MLGKKVIDSEDFFPARDDFSKTAERCNAEPFGNERRYSA